MEKDDIINTITGKGCLSFSNNKGFLSITVETKMENDNIEPKEYKIPLSRILIKNDQIRNRNIKAFGEDHGYTYFIGWDDLKPLTYDKYKEILNEIVTQVNMCKMGIDDSHLRHIIFLATYQILKK